MLKMYFSFDFELKYLYKCVDLIEVHVAVSLNVIGPFSVDGTVNKRCNEISSTLTRNL